MTKADRRAYRRLVRVLSTVSLGDAEADRIGKQLAKDLFLKRDRDHRDRWHTNWGTKTDRGLARTILRVVREELEIELLGEP